MGGAMGETEATTILHLEANAPDEGLCGDEKIQTTPDPALVTCRRCIARMGGPAPSPGQLGALPYTTRAHTLGAYEHRIASTPVGDPLPRPPRWDSLSKAAEHWARVVDDGAPIRSAFRTEFVQSSGAADAGICGREDVLAFTRALEAAYRHERHFPQASVSVEAQRLILEARLCGVPRIEPIGCGRKGRVVRRHEVSATELVPLLRERFGLELTVHQVGVIYRDGMRAMRERLERAGELRPMRRSTWKTIGIEEGSEMPRPPDGWDCDGWNEIADAVGLHPDTARKLAKRPSDPLPVADFMGRVIAKKTELDAWLERQVRPRANGAA